MNKELSTREFLQYFPDTILQTFSDVEKGSGARMFIQYDEPELKRLNEEKAGIFFSVNAFENHRSTSCHRECDPKNCSLTKLCSNSVNHLKQLNAAYADMDIAKNGDRQSFALINEKKRKLWTDLLKAPLLPNIIIVTKNGLQPIWLIREELIGSDVQAVYKEILSGIISYSVDIGSLGDEVKDIARVLRLAGYFHQKSEPFEIKAYLIHEKRYLLTELKQAFPYFDESVITRDNLNTRAVLGGESNRLDTIDIKDIALHFLQNDYGEPNAYFDKRNRLFLDRGVTGAFIGKTGDGQFIASNSHDIPAGNKVTFVARLLKISNKEAFKLICERFNIPLPPQSPPPTYPSATVELPEMNAGELTEIINRPSVGIKTGYTFFDRAAGDGKGILEDSSVVVVAQSKNWKSLFVLNLTLNIVRINPKHGVVFFDLENGMSRSWKRFTGVYTGWQRVFYEDEKNRPIVQTAIEKMQREMKFTIVTDFSKRGGLEGYEYIGLIIRDAVRKGRGNIFILDNLKALTKMKGMHGNYERGDYQALCLGKLQELCNELHIILFIVHHATEKNNEKKTGLTPDELLMGKRGEIRVPFIEKALGTSDISQICSIGMTTAFDSVTNRLYCWIQQNRDGGPAYDSLFADIKTFRLFNSIHEMDQQVILPKSVEAIQKMQEKDALSHHSEHSIPSSEKESVPEAPGSSDDEIVIEEEIPF